MAHHAYVLEGGQEYVLAQAQTAAKDLVRGRGDTQSFAFDQLSIEQARKLRELAYQGGSENGRVIILYAARLFHEAQNALLKVFEEPPDGTTLILGVPSLGMLLPTLRSRLVPLGRKRDGNSQAATAFLELSTAERSKYLAKLIERSKADSDSVKQAARAEAIIILGTLSRQAHQALAVENNPEGRFELLAYLEDLTSFMPLMHERSAPLKLIFEHLDLVIPKSLVEGQV